MTAPDQPQAGAAALAIEPGREAPAILSPIRVRPERSEVAGFLRETGGAGPADFVPLTFPFRWLALPAIRRAILQAIGGDGFLPVHEAQSFDYERPLRIETDYGLAVEIERSENPPRLTLKMAVSTLEGEMCVHLETILRIVRLTAERPS